MNQSPVLPSPHAAAAGSDGTRIPVGGPLEIDGGDLDAVNGGMLLLGFAIGMLIDRYLIAPLWN